VLVDLDAESVALESIVEGLSDADWWRPTPAEGWSVIHAIAHLAWTDEVALAALTDVSRLAEFREEETANPLGFADHSARKVAEMEPHRLLLRWRESRGALRNALRSHPPQRRVPWFGPPMSPTSMATARLMETWAHGVDVTDGLGHPMSVSDRLVHVVHLGVRTRNYAFAVRGMPPPDNDVFVDLAAPGGGRWTFGSADSPNRIVGPGLDFALLVTRRRHRNDLALVATGELADTWLSIAQAFAGPPGADRAPSD
jgi:uncharacterized protein (TIGR03084 family)